MCKMPVLFNISGVFPRNKHDDLSDTKFTPREYRLYQRQLLLLGSYPHAVTRN